MRWVLLLAAAGCYAPNPQAGAPCAKGRCPVPLVCSPASDTCEAIAVDASTIDAPAIDGPVIGPDAATVPMVHQQAMNYNPSTTSVSASLPAAPVAGRMLVLVGAHLSGSIATVTGGATWTRAVNSVINSNIEIWYGVANGSSATVTIDRPGVDAPMWLAVSEWSGLATLNSLDVTRAAFGGNAVVPSAGSITTTNARDLILFAVTGYSPTTFALPSPGTWTALQGVVGQAQTQAAWYRIESATVTIAPQTTQTGTGTWEAAIAALRIAP